MTYHPKKIMPCSIFFFLFFFFCGHNTVNPLYNDIRYNKILNNANLFCTKISGSCIFSMISHVILQENTHFVYLLESPRRGDSNNYTKHMIYNRKKLFRSIHYWCSRWVLSSFYITANSIYSKIFGNKHYRYSKGPLYI